MRFLFRVSKDIHATFMRYQSYNDRVWKRGEESGFPPFDSRQEGQDFSTIFF